MCPLCLTIAGLVAAGAGGVGVRLDRRKRAGHPGEHVDGVEVLHDGSGPARAGPVPPQSLSSRSMSRAGVTLVSSGTSVIVRV
jgi:hypothetical protein